MKSKILINLSTESRGEPLIAEIPHNIFLRCKELLTHDGTTTSTIDGKKCRILKKTHQTYSAIAYTENPDRIKSKKILEFEIDVFLSVADAIETATIRAEARTRRLLHNLRSLTAKTSQEIFLLAQQDKLLGDPQKIISYLSEEIRNDIDGTAKALLQILKHQAAQKAEYTAFDRLSGQIEQGSFELHDVHRVLMNVFYLFFGEFLSKKVHAEVERTKIQAKFDYDSIHVCIYYLVENAVKYIRPNSNLSVTTSANNGLIDIRFSMESLAINANEKDLIFLEGHSGEKAREHKLNGGGLGLYLARAMANANSGQLNLINNKPTGNEKYARNIFILTLPEK